ncbi:MULTISPECIES: hypothetical protein [Streptococcus]|uniref:Uncharacterized protein n=1 Tax=Streptococcus pluranimalium TaxID=82348 RepID=A0A2L0D6S7_9STRE|nr:MULTISPECIES: hypothetical protein [Streptococcus]AUW97507.1 hypothetical protein C0J00_02495 [Streptococcus pluranimalium]
MKEKETLTKRQQDNVVRGIARNYDIKSIKFTKINRDSKTGSYHLLFIINDHEKYKTGITVSKISEFDEKLDNIGLSPIDDFKFIERDKPINNTDNILKTIEITYLGE